MQSFKHLNSFAYSEFQVNTISNAYSTALLTYMHSSKKNSIWLAQMGKKITFFYQQIT